MAVGGGDGGATAGRAAAACDAVEAWNRRAVERLASRQYQRCERLLRDAERLTRPDGDRRFGGAARRMRLRAATCSNLACLHKARGDPATALAAIEEALGIEEGLGQQAPGTMLNFAAILLAHPDVRRRREAAIPAAAAAALLQAALDPGDGGTPRAPPAGPLTAEQRGVWHQYAVALHATAMAAAAGGELPPAQDLRDAHAIAVAVLGPRHPTTERLYREVLGARAG